MNLVEFIDNNGKESVSVGMWTAICCELDLQEIDEEILSDIIYEYDEYKEDGEPTTYCCIFKTKQEGLTYFKCDS